MAVDNGDLNITLRLFGVRGEQVVDLTRPNESVRYGAIVDFPQGGEQFLVNEYRPGDSFWGCIEERTIQWTWGANTFTPQPLIDTYFPQDTLACRLPSREALFGGPTAEGVAALETVVDGAELLNNPADEPTLARVNMTLAVLYLFDGRRAEGQTLAASLADMPDTGSWVDAQSRAFLRIFDQGGSNLPLEVCAELDRIADGDGACALGAATEATLNALPLDSTISLEEQLDILGFTVHDNLTVREAGRRDRQVVRFSLSDALWFEFTPAPNLDDPLVFDRYTIALTNTPPQFTPPDPTPTVTDLPQSALDALFLSDEPLAAVNIIDTAQGSSGLPLTDAARYVRALALDLAANRQPAREAYYALWTDAPNTVWGQLAARHLERRG